MKYKKILLIILISSMILVSGCSLINKQKCIQSGGYWHKCEYGIQGTSGCVCDCNKNGKIQYNKNECKTKNEMIQLGCSFPFPNEPLKQKCSEDIICCRISNVGILNEEKVVNIQYMVVTKMWCLEKNYEMVREGLC